MTATATPTPTGLGLELTPEQEELQARARRFTEEVLIPREELSERNGGRLPAGEIEQIRAAAIEARLNGGRHSAENGGQGWSMFETFLVGEQFGRCTNGLHWYVPGAYNVLELGTPEQIERYLRPALRGEGDTAYAVTEEHAGSDPSKIATTATRSDGGWVIDGEKWFVTSADAALVMIVMAHRDRRRGAPPHPVPGRARRRRGRVRRRPALHPQLPARAPDRALQRGGGRRGRDPRRSRRGR